MEDIEKNEYMMIEGGLSVSGTLIISFSTCIKIILEVGRSLGSAIRRGSSGKLCKIQ